MDRNRESVSGLTVVVPVLDEIGEIVSWIRHTAGRLPGSAILVVDGGSTDDTVDAVRGLMEKPAKRKLDEAVGEVRLQVLDSVRGRGSQLAAGARHALDGGASHLLFLHVDTALSPEAAGSVVRACSDPGFRWGWFKLRLDGSSWQERLIERGINVRARWTGRPTGDQGLLVSRETYEASGGFAPIPLFEDVDLADRLRREGKGRRLAGEVITSGRRYRQEGYFQTTLLMWWLRLRWRLGSTPESLARRYGAS
ncbi:MAG: TIGR04283 family arsenosugar biosynthesis glycosyltransferase [bacterium]